MFSRNRFAPVLAAVVAFSPAARAAPPGQAGREPDVRAAIDRGVASLKKQQNRDGTWPFHENRAGATGLAGLTLLECGVPATDKVIQKAAEALRPASIGLTDTYSLSTVILFFDRLGDPRDSLLIQSMAVRLLAGQNGSNGWTYQCPPLPVDEARRLNKLLKQRNELVGKRQPPKGGRPVGGPGEERKLSKEIQNQLKLVSREVPFGQMSDNSNTKFATLALWVARRHGIPVTTALSRVETRFRNSQNPDGGWGYLPRGGLPVLNLRDSSGPMTSAGLLGLAFGFGAAKEAALRTSLPGQEGDGGAKKGEDKTFRDPARDVAVRSGLIFLGQALAQVENGAGLGAGAIPLWNPKEGDIYYFLWTVERVAVAYGLKTIGGKEWYDLGSRYLANAQRADGSWANHYEGGVDTCFALLFLSRANLAVDLSSKLKGVEDPVALKAAGIGGEALQPKEPKKPEGKPVTTPDQPSRPVPVETPTRPATPANVVEPPEPDFDAEVARYAGRLVKAPEAKQGALIEEYQKTKGAVYTQALARAIRDLYGEPKKKARDALEERLSRMTASTLREKLRDEDAEIRSAAALACALKEEKSHIPSLIDLLTDREPRVGRAAHVALKHLTGEDFGPSPDARPAERMAAAASWKAWWKKQGAR